MSFTLGDILCKGKFSDVYNLQDKENKKTYVIKFIESKNLNTLEIYIMKNLIHTNITNLINYEQTDKGLTKIIFEKATDDLKKYIKNVKPTNEQKKIISLNIAKGLEFLHDKKIIHGDIKPENILIYNKIAKISDFGLSCYENFVPFKILYTLEYRPPEKNYCTKSDIWAYGCTLYEIYEFKKTKELLSLINNCIIEKNKRLTIKNILEHNYFCDLK